MRTKVTLYALLASISAMFAGPAQAMNWCALPQIFPTQESDMERLAPSVAGLTGCERQPSDSAHTRKWICADDPATIEQFEGATIFYFREPGEGINMVVLTLGMTNLDALRRCGIRGLRDGERFTAGNVALRDRVSFDIPRKSFTLTAINNFGMAAIVTNTGYLDDDASVISIWNGVHGIAVERYPTTEVSLAGLSPISSDVFAIVDAFRSRGSEILSSEDLEGTVPKWTMSPPIGLAGVREVEIVGFSRHFLWADYILESTTDYERFISLLDGEYGQSVRSSEGVCTYRWWHSGRASVRGEHCPDSNDSLRFINVVAQDQLTQVSVRMDEDEARQREEVPTSVIDQDMF